MTIRWKLNLLLAAIIAVFLVAVGLAMSAVELNAQNTRRYSRMRGLSQFTAEVRTHIYEHVAAAGGMLDLPDNPDHPDWPYIVLSDIDVQIRLSEDRHERRLWQDLYVAINRLGGLFSEGRDREQLQENLRKAELCLRDLRQFYDLAETDLIKTLAGTSYRAQVAVLLACAITVILFLLCMFLLKHWFVRPIEIIKRSADEIGAGRLAHRVPLQGGDELAGLARQLDAMADRLARHQHELIRTRELTAVGELSTNVAHGLRNPLAAIRASAQLALRKTPDNPQLREMIQELLDQVDRMDERISKIFEFSRAVTMNKRPTQFAQLAESVRRETAYVLESRRIAFTFEDSTNARTWFLDQEQLVSGIAELVVNAMHHSPAGAIIVVRGSTLAALNGSGPRLQIEVQDHGAGMSPATLEKAFDMFFTSRADGTGMGLALVRRIVEKHGGSIELTSRQGEGTLVRIVLPELVDQAETLL